VSDEPLELPELHQAVLGSAEVDALFADIAALTEVVEVSVKGRALAGAGEGGTTLAIARGALAAGAVCGVQIRYRHRGVEWWDTLLRAQDGVKLVRIEAPRHC
jgi:hypothetical protein